MDKATYSIKFSSKIIEDLVWNIEKRFLRSSAK